MYQIYRKQQSWLRNRLGVPGMTQNITEFTSDDEIVATDDTTEISLGPHLYVLGNEPD